MPLYIITYLDYEEFGDEEQEEIVWGKDPEEALDRFANTIPADEITHCQEVEDGSSIVC